MCHLMASDKLEEQIPKLIPAILALYKKNNEHYVISKVGMGCSCAVDCLLAFNRVSVSYDVLQQCLFFKSGFSSQCV